MLSVRALTATQAPPVTPSPGSPPSSVKRVAIFVATRWEWAAVQAGLPPGSDSVSDGVRVFIGGVGEREYWLIRTGVGPEKAGRVANRILPRHTWEVALSTGYASALRPAQVGDFIVATAVTDSVSGLKGSAVPTDDADAVLNQILALMSPMPARTHAGLMLSVARIVCQASEKARLAVSSGAVGLDMESAALAQEAQKAGVPFVVVRTVSDLADEDLPLDFNLFLRPAGWLVGIGSILSAPSRLAGLVRLRRQSRLAAANLTKFFAAYAASAASLSRAMCP